MKFGEKIRILRTLEAITQSELAAASGLQQSAIARYEKGDVIPYSSPFSKLAKALGQTINMKWLQAREKYMLKSGLSIYRPMSPFCTYTSIMVRSIDNSLATLLPTFTDELELHNKKIFKSPYGSILYATNNINCGIAIICRPEIADALHVAYPEIQSIEKILDMDMLNALIFTDAEIVYKYSGIRGEMLYDPSARVYLPAQIEAEVNVLINLISKSIPDTIIEELKEFATILFKSKGLDVNITIEKKIKDKQTVEQLIDPSFWKFVSKDFKFNENNGAVVPIHWE